MIETMLTLMLIFFAVSGFIAWVVAILLLFYYYACMPKERNGK